MHSNIQSLLVLSDKTKSCHSCQEIYVRSHSSADMTKTTVLHVSDILVIATIRSN